MHSGSAFFRSSSGGGRGGTFGWRLLVPPPIIVGHRIIDLPPAVDQAARGELQFIPPASKQTVVSHPPAYQEAVLSKRLATVARAGRMHGASPSADRRKVVQPLVVEKEKRAGRSGRLIIAGFHGGRGSTSSGAQRKKEKNPPQKDFMPGFQVDGPVPHTPFQGGARVHASALSAPECTCPGHNQVHASSHHNGCGAGRKVGRVAQGEPGEGEYNGQSRGKDHGDPQPI